MANFGLENIQQQNQKYNSNQKRPVEELEKELEENKKKLRKWKKRAIDEKKKIENFKEEEDKNILNASYSTWSDLNTTFTSISSKSPTPSQPGSSPL